VNVGHEEQGWLLPRPVGSVLDTIGGRCRTVRIRGLIVHSTRARAARGRAPRGSVGYRSGRQHGLRERSMGMSGDFECDRRGVDDGPGRHRDSSVRARPTASIRGNERQVKRVGFIAAATGRCLINGRWAPVSFPRQITATDVADDRASQITRQISITAPVRTTAAVCATPTW